MASFSVFLFQSNQIHNYSLTIHPESGDQSVVNDVYALRFINFEESWFQKGEVLNLPPLLLEEFNRYNALVLPFTKFVDGRSYSLAHILRRNGYQGNLFAGGHFTVDQIPNLKAAGFAGFDLTFLPEEAVWRKRVEQCFHLHPLRYQVSPSL